MERSRTIALELLGEGKKLAKDISEDTQICAVLIGNNIDHLAQECFEYGAEKVYMVQDPLLENFTTDGYTKVMKQLIDEYKPEIVLYGATHIGRDFAHVSQQDATPVLLLTVLTLTLRFPSTSNSQKQTLH